MDAPAIYIPSSCYLTVCFCLVVLCYHNFRRIISPDTSELHAGEYCTLAVAQALHSACFCCLSYCVLHSLYVFSDNIFLGLHLFPETICDPRDDWWHCECPSWNLTLLTNIDSNSICDGCLCCLDHICVIPMISVTTVSSLCVCFQIQHFPHACKLLRAPGSTCWYIHPCGNGVMGQSDDWGELQETTGDCQVKEEGKTYNVTYVSQCMQNIQC